MNIEKSITDTRRGFEQSFREAAYYNKQTVDDNHLKLLLDLVYPQENDTILDLGTGSGYIAFSLAEHNYGCNVIGMDIVVDTLERNVKKAREQGNDNLQFKAYDGKLYPFEDECIDTIVTRYALHHFPNIEDSFCEMYRVLKKRGKLVISDPTPNENDTVGFVDDFMQMQPDGHIKFYTFKELNEMLVRAGFQFELQKNTTIKFPRKNRREYEQLLSKYDKGIWEDYEIEIANNEIWIKENVLNIVYRKA